MMGRKSQLFNPLFKHSYYRDARGNNYVAEILEVSTTQVIFSHSPLFG